jgi:hypothetical protein
MDVKSIISKGISADDYHIKLGEIAQSGIYKNEQEGAQKLEFIKLNHARTKRILKQTKVPDELSEKLKSLNSVYYWVVISEPWCGDSANVLPVIAKLSEEGKSINLSVLLRDEHPEIMDEFLTKGTRSIPKLICFDENHSLVGTWGPRPEALQVYVDYVKLTESISSNKLKERIQVWYNTDKGASIYDELGSTLSLWFSEEEINEEL